jgi:hypothetical protein
MNVARHARTMRKKIFAAIVLIAVVGALEVVVGAMEFALIVLYRPPTDGPLRVGMTGEELDQALDQPEYAKWCRNCIPNGRHLSDRGECVAYWLPRDWKGNKRDVGVYFNDEGRVVSWEARTLGVAPSPWDSFLHDIGLK